MLLLKKRRLRRKNTRIKLPLLKLREKESLMRRRDKPETRNSTSLIPTRATRKPISLLSRKSLTNNST